LEWKRIGTTSDLLGVGFFCSAGVPASVFEDDEPTVNLNNGFAVVTTVLNPKS